MLPPKCVPQEKLRELEGQGELAVKGKQSVSSGNKKCFGTSLIGAGRMEKAALANDDLQQYAGGGGGGVSSRIDTPGIS